MLLLYTFDIPKIIESFVVGFFSSLLVSGIFLWLILHKLRPNIIISPFLCKSLEKYDDNGTVKTRNKYTLKIVNKSIYDCFDINIELLLLSPTNHLGANSNLISRHLKVRTSNMTHISRFRKTPDKKDPFMKFAILIHTSEDLEPLLTVPQSFVQLKITARHGLSGLAKTFEQHFPDPTVIKEAHKFGSGLNCQTVPFNKSI